MRRFFSVAILATFACAFRLNAEDTKKNPGVVVPTSCVEGMNGFGFTNAELIASAPSEIRKELSWMDSKDSDLSTMLDGKEKEDSDCTLGYFSVMGQKKDKTQGAILIGRLVVESVDGKGKSIDYQLFGVFLVRQAGTGSTLVIWLNSKYSDQKYNGISFAEFSKKIPEILQKSLDEKK